MKNKDEILKYLSDLMNETEKVSFEKELASSDELQQELARYRNILSGFKTEEEIPVDSHYFQNLLPRVRTRLEKQKSRRWIPQFAYLIPTAAVVFLILMNIGKFNNNTQTTEAVEKTDSAVVSSSSTESIYTDYKLATDLEPFEIEKKQNISFEVGIGEVANKECIKEIMKNRFNYPFEEYLVASK